MPMPADQWRRLLDQRMPEAITALGWVSAPRRNLVWARLDRRDHEPERHSERRLFARLR